MFFRLIRHGKYQTLMEDSVKMFLNLNFIKRKYNNFWPDILQASEVPQFTKQIKMNLIYTHSVL